MRTVVAVLFVMLAALSTDGAREQHDASVRGPASCIREAPQPQPQPGSEAVLRAPGVGVAPSPMRWAALVSCGTLPLPSSVHHPRPLAPVADAFSAPQFRRFPLLI